MNHHAQWLPVAMVVPPTQSIGNNNNSTYMSYMSPLTAHALGLPYRKYSGMLGSGWKWGLIRLQTNHDFKSGIKPFWRSIGHGDSRVFCGGLLQTRLIVILFPEKYLWKVWDHAQITAQTKSLISKRQGIRTTQTTKCKGVSLPFLAAGLDVKNVMDLRRNKKLLP